ncbi:MAG: DUF1328 family protein [Aquisalimonadaceae bacterium]
MPIWPLVFIIIAMIAALLAYSGIAGDASGLAQALFVVSIIAFLAALIQGRKRP